MDGRWLALGVVGAAVGLGAARSRIRVGPGYSPLLTPHSLQCGRRSGSGVAGSAVRVGPRLAAKGRRREDYAPQFESVLVLSTAHLSKEEAERLDRVFPERLVKEYEVIARAERKLKTFLSFQTDYGWLVYARYDEGMQAEMADEMPVLAEVLRFAQGLGVTWVRFDADASTVAGLDVFDW